MKAIIFAILSYIFTSFLFAPIQRFVSEYVTIEQTPGGSGILLIASMFFNIMPVYVAAKVYFKVKDKAIMLKKLEAENKKLSTAASTAAATTVTTSSRAVGNNIGFDDEFDWSDIDDHDPEYDSEIKYVSEIDEGIDYGYAEDLGYEDRDYSRDH